VSGRLTIHAWGFFDGDDRRPFDGVAVSAETVIEVCQRLERHIAHFDAEVTDTRVARTLDGWLIGLDFVTPAGGDAARIWHTVCRESDSWPDFPTNPNPEALASESDVT